ncbi:MAG: histidinol dehydrogenase, partial [Gammaproteobacteria bacterium]|nr:histidinol dehydrogenase [Gammaproteobacteria bacterium]
MEIIKQAPSLRADDDPEVVRRVTEIINNIRQEGETAVRRLARELDDWEQDFVLSDEKRTALISQVSEQTKTDLQFAWHQIKRFAQAQMDSLTEFEIETEPGVTLGQRLVPVGSAGCYVPGGRYAHAASALMSITTAKTAGVSKIIACSPPRGESIHPAVVYAMDLAGADVILELGGVQAIAT